MNQAVWNLNTDVSKALDVGPQIRKVTMHVWSHHCFNSSQMRKNTGCLSTTSVLFRMSDFPETSNISKLILSGFLIKCTS